MSGQGSSRSGRRRLGWDDAPGFVEVSTAERSDPWKAPNARLGGSGSPPAAPALLSMGSSHAFLRAPVLMACPAPVEVFVAEAGV